MIFSSHCCTFFSLFSLFFIFRIYQLQIKIYNIQITKLQYTKLKIFPHSFFSLSSVFLLFSSLPSLPSPSPFSLFPFPFPPFLFFSFSLLPSLFFPFTFLLFLFLLSFFFFFSSYFFLLLYLRSPARGGSMMPMILVLRGMFLKTSTIISSALPHTN